MFTPYFLATSSDSRTLCPEDTRERSSLLWPRGARMREEGADDSGSKKLSSSTIELTLRPCQVAFATVFCCRRDVPLLPTFALHRRWGSFPLCWSLRAPHKKAKQFKQNLRCSWCVRLVSAAMPQRHGSNRLCRQEVRFALTCTLYWPRGSFSLRWPWRWQKQKPKHFFLPFIFKNDK